MTCIDLAYMKDVFQKPLIQVKDSLSRLKHAGTKRVQTVLSAHFHTDCIVIKARWNTHEWMSAILRIYVLVQAGLDIQTE